MNLHEPVHFFHAREQTVRARLDEFAHAVGHQVDADADHAAIGERFQLALGQAGFHQRDAFETSAGMGDGVEHAAIIPAIRPGADQQTVCQSMRIEHRAELSGRAGLAGVRLVVHGGRKRVLVAAKNMGVTIDGASGGHLWPAS